MNIALIRESIHLGNTLNINKTANDMFISQSALSKHISVMEKELHAQLFIRSKHSVKLTDAGRLFYDRAKKIIALYDSAIHELDLASKEMSGALRVGFLDAAVRTFLGSAIHEFEILFPNIELVLYSAEWGELERKLKRDELDLALSIQFQNSILPSGWIFQELIDDELAGVVPNDNPLASRRTVSFSELMAYPMILPDPYLYTDYARLIMKMEEHSGLHADIAHQFTHVNTALVMVESSDAVTIIPKHLECYSHSTCFIPLDDECSTFKVGALWKESNAVTGIVQFVDLLMKHADEYKQTDTPTVYTVQSG